MDASEDSRSDYGVGSLTDAALSADPHVLLRQWLADAIGTEAPEPTAVTIATVDAAGIPDARVLLVRSMGERGATFYTNRRSPMGQQLAANPVAALVAHWRLHERQVRMRGAVEHLPDAESDTYFASRPRASQIGAWASDQSEPIADRAALEAGVAAVEARFEGRAVPRPAHWGGYLLRPDTIELWQGRPARLHDRIRYRRDDGGWFAQRLQP